MNFKIRRGLDLPIKGAAKPLLRGSVSTTKVAVIGPDYVGMKPTMLVKPGDTVKKGQKLFEDKKNPGVFWTASASGTVESVNRGDKRLFLSVIIEKSTNTDQITFKSYPDSELSSLDSKSVQDNLIESGMWTALRTRPFSKAPAPDSKPAAIFVTAMDTNPLAPDPVAYISSNEAAFNNGLIILSRLTDGMVHLCKATGTEVKGAELDKVDVHSFEGPHPAGLAGTHIHFIDPVHEKKTSWSIGYQDVIAFGKLFSTGEIFTERWVTVAGPACTSPKLIKTELGADLLEIVGNDQESGENRIISGSAICGRQSSEKMHFLGRFHSQITVLKEDRSRQLLGWKMPGFNKFSVKRTFTSTPFFWKKYAFGTNKNGSDRAMVPVGSFEKVMPLDIVPTFFLRSLLSDDVEQAIALGLLELDEEDLALCTFACPGKTDYAPLLRKLLTHYEKEG